MAVQKKRSTHSKIRMRRAHDHLKPTECSIESKSSSKIHLNHHLTEDGFYGGKQVIPVKLKEKKKQEETEQES